MRAPLQTLVKSCSSALGVSIGSGTRDSTGGNQSIEQVGLVIHDRGDNDSPSVSYDPVDIVLRPLSRW